MSREKDLQFMRAARYVAMRSKCGSRQIGSVLVQDGSVVSEGYNGAPRGISLCQYGECVRKGMGCQSGERLDLCPAVHSEQNALLQAARNGITTRGATMYTYCCRPCKACMGSIINAGVKRLVHLDEECYDEMSGMMLEESGIEVFTVTRAEVEATQ